MRDYDDMVIGSGVSGLTAALLLAAQGRKVLVVEKAARIGGGLCRFYREGCPIDTGFHFTGGLHKNGVLDAMLTVLGLREGVEPVAMSPQHAHRFVFESEGRSFDMPCGFHALRERWHSYFPAERAAIDRYFDLVHNVCQQTAVTDIRLMAAPRRLGEEDFVSLKEIVDRLTGNEMLKGLFCAFGMCYGAKPSEVSFANHSRVAYGFYESVMRLKGGGEALIQRFQERLQALGVKILCNRHVVQFADVRHDRVGRGTLDTGEAVTFENCLLTIHPQAVLELLPREHLSRAFIERVRGFESSSGFFSVYGTVVDNGADQDLTSTIVSLFPVADFEKLHDPAQRGDGALVIVTSNEEVGGRPLKAFHALERSYAEHVAAWSDTTTGQRPPAYQEYKQERVERICRRIARVYPAYGDRLRVLGSASVLTYRDYLNSPDGSAYGIKQKIGQYNLLGKLPLENLYVAGQSSWLPGVVGAMMSAFAVCRAALGKKKFDAFMDARLCN